MQTVRLAGGTVIDGSAARPILADLVIQGDRIAAIVPHAERQRGAEQRIDVRGLVVAPGFIDAHTHGDLVPFLGVPDKRYATASIRQGITTEVVGNCGHSPFPSSAEWHDVIHADMRANAGEDAPVFMTLDDYRKAGEHAGCWTNLAPLIGHSMVRAAVMGHAARPSDGDERERMAGLVADAMAAGAFGLSTGLSYAPGSFAGTDEIVHLAREVEQAGGVHSTHMRDQAGEILAAIDEVLHVSESSGVALQISHLKVAGGVNAGRSAEILAHIERARASGIDVHFDVYHYDSGGTTIRQVLPPWLSADGLEVLLKRLDDPEVRARLHRDLDPGADSARGQVLADGWDRITLLGLQSSPELNGVNVLAASKSRDTSPVDLLVDLVRQEHGGGMVAIRAMDHNDIAAFDDHPLGMFGSDAVPKESLPHPRMGGAAARCLAMHRARHGRLADNQDSWVDRIHRMTGMTARRFAVPERGTLSPGSIADVVVFDPDTVVDQADFPNPTRPPAGIAHVFVSGAQVVRHGELGGTPAGRILRRGPRP